MRILVVGAGAVGGYFGARLADAGRDVTVLVRSRRAAQMKAAGLQILSPHGNLTLHPAEIAADQIAGPYDLILLGVKSYALAGAMDDFAPAVGSETMILPVLNGMRHIDALTGRFGKSCVLGGVCLVATEIDDEGRIRQLADFQSLIYGEIDGPATPRLQAVDAALRGAGFDAIEDRVLRRVLNQTDDVTAPTVPLSAPATCSALGRRVRHHRRRRRPGLGLPDLLDGGHVPEAGGGCVRHSAEIPVHAAAGKLR